MCDCLNQIRKKIIKKNAGTYCYIELSNITSFDENRNPIAESQTGQEIVYDYAHVLKSGGVTLKKKKSFLTHDFCPFCGTKYIQEP